jgi:hypothetical protein
MMDEFFKMNYDRLGMHERGKEIEWYTANVTRVLVLHVHNETGVWSWQVRSLSGTRSGVAESKEQAFDQATKAANLILQNAIAHLPRG